MDENWRVSGEHLIIGIDTGDCKERVYSYKTYENHRYEKASYCHY